jgi:prepilin-type N-terminal cleavage/methylation domain-containing protein
VRRLSLGSQKGFTLLEVMIAFALLTGILFVAVISQSSSLASSSRSKNILIATSLARNFINQQEVLLEGMPFNQIQSQQEGQFPDPHGEFRWTMAVEEVDFSVLSQLLGRQAEASGQQQEEHTATVLKLFEEYLKKSVRKMTVTIHYPDSGETSTLSFTQLLVNYDADFGI